MSVIANPYDNPDAWGIVKIGGATMPGVLESLGLPPRKYEWAVQQGLGVGGPATIYRYCNLIESIEIAQFLDTVQAFEIAETMCKTLVGPKWPNEVKVKPKAYLMEHPALQWVGVRRVALRELEAPKPVGNLKWMWLVRVIEDSPRRPVQTGPPEPAKINGPPQPQDALEAALVGALAEFNKP